jgi:outer membrane protein assembly factor BamB
VSDGASTSSRTTREQPSIAALDAKTGAELWRTARSGTGFPVKSSWMTPFVWKNDAAHRDRHDGLGRGRVLRRQGRELWRINRMSMPTASPFASGGLLYVGTGSQADANRPFMAVRPGGAGDLTLTAGQTSNDFVVWRSRASPATRRPRSCTTGAPSSFTTRAC